MTRVAVVGIGRMGAAMAQALAGGGHELILHNRTRERAATVARKLGAAVAETPAAAARDADVTISMLGDDAAVEAVFDGPDGLLAGAREGSLLIDCSTVRPDTLRAFASAAHERGVGLLDAPVSGSTALAAGGQLTVMVGGDAADVERARPVLDALATRVIHVGPLGSGAAVKLAVNGVIFAVDVALSEAIVLAERAGVDRSTAYDVLEASVVGSPFVGYKRAAFIDPDAAPVAFALELAEKDLRLITSFGEALDVPMAQAQTNLDVIREASTSQGPEVDFARVAVHLRKRGDAAQRGGEGSS